MISSAMRGKTARADFRVPRAVVRFTTSLNRLGWSDVKIRLALTSQHLRHLFPRHLSKAKLSAP